MSFSDAAQTASRASNAARKVSRSAEDPGIDGLCDAVALLAKAVQQLAEAHQRAS